MTRAGRSDPLRCEPARERGAGAGGKPCPCTCTCVPIELPEPGPTVATTALGSYAVARDGEVPGPTLAYPAYLIAPDIGYGIATGPPHMRDLSHLLLDAQVFAEPPPPIDAQLAPLGPARAIETGSPVPPVGAPRLGADRPAAGGFASAAHTVAIHPGESPVVLVAPGAKAGVGTLVGSAAEAGGWSPPAPLLPWPGGSRTVRTRPLPGRSSAHKAQVPTG